MTTSNPIAVRKVLLEPDDPELPGAAPGSNATACTANEPPCRCRGSAQRDRFRTTSSDASHARLERSAHRRPHDRFCASVGPQACERNRVKSITREDRAARPLCDRERSSPFGPALMSRGVCRPTSRQSPFAPWAPQRADRSSFGRATPPAVALAARWGTFINDLQMLVEL